MQSQIEQKSIEMQRDMDLVRELLLKIEANPLCDGTRWNTIYIPGHSVEETNYHLKLLEQAGYISGNQPVVHYQVSALTWRGHEFLDNIKDAGIWSQVKEKSKDLGGVGLKIIEEIASSLIRAHFHLP